MFKVMCIIGVSKKDASIYIFIEGSDEIFVSDIYTVIETVKHPSREGEVGYILAERNPDSVYHSRCFAVLNSLIEEEIKNQIYV